MKGSRQGNKSQSPKNKRRKALLGFSALLLLTMILTLYAIRMHKKGILAVVEGQLAKLREHRITQAYYDYTSTEFQDATSLEEYREFVSLNKVLVNNKAFVFEELERNGNKSSVIGSLVSTDLYEMQVEFGLVKENHSWKIQSLRLKETGKEGVKSITNELANVVHAQLQALQKGEILESYYHYLSKDFLRDASFETFCEFVSSHPILTSFKNISYKKRKIENGFGFVQAILSAETGHFLVEWKLKKQNGKWKVWSLAVLLPPQEAMKRAATDPGALSIPVRKLLDALLLNNVQKAYRGTAREFQEATTLEDFEAFVDAHPVLTNRDLADFKTGRIENSIGTLKVNVHNEHGMTAMEFRLGFDEGEWKIWAIKVISEDPKIDSSSSFMTLDDSQHAVESLQPRATSDSIQKTVSNITNVEAFSTVSSAPLTQRFASELESRSGLQEYNYQRLATELMKIVKQKFQLLRHHDLTTIYDTFLTGDYKMHHSFADFEAYIFDHPTVTIYSNAVFNTIKQTDKFVTLKAWMKTLDNAYYSISHVFEREGDKWKIADFNISEIEEVPTKVDEEKADSFEAEEEVPLAQTFISQISVGSDVDDQGFILVPQIVLDSDINLLFINVEIINGTAGSLVSAHLHHIDSGTTAPAVSTSLKEDGRTFVMLSYAAPETGWPEGNYLIKVTINGAVEQSQGFQLRQGEGQPQMQNFLEPVQRL